MAHFKAKVPQWVYNFLDKMLGLVGNIFFKKKKEDYNKESILSSAEIDEVKAKFKISDDVKLYSDNDLRYKAVGMVDSITNFMQPMSEQKKSRKIIEDFLEIIKNAKPRIIRDIDARWGYPAPQSKDPRIKQYTSLVPLGKE